jgi:uncharacterized protein (TIGR03792 family)
MDLNQRRTPLDAPGIPEVDGELASRAGRHGQVQVEVIEHLRVSVPAAARQAWLEAEAASWEPWLQGQPGFLGRELHWDRERQEGQLLIRWASREQWHAIPRDEIDAVQEHFERLAHAALERLGVVSPLEAIADAERSAAATASTATASTATASPATPSAASKSSPLASLASASPGTGDLISGSEGACVQAPAGAHQATPPNPFPLVYAGELPPDAHA